MYVFTQVNSVKTQITIQQEGWELYMQASGAEQVSMKELRRAWEPTVIYQ